MASFRRRRRKNEDRHRRRGAEALFLVRLPPFLPPKFLGGTNILASFTHLTDRQPRSLSGQGSNQRAVYRKGNLTRELVRSGRVNSGGNPDDTRYNQGRSVMSQTCLTGTLIYGSNHALIIRFVVFECALNR